MIKLIVFDLDNTLAAPGKGILVSDIEKIKKLENRGIKIAIASGKTVDYLSGFVRQVGLKNPILLGENGAMIQIGVEWPPQMQEVLPYSKEAKEVLTFLKEEIDAKIPGIWYQPNRVAVSPFPSCEEEFEIIADILKENENRLQDIIVFRHADCYDLVPKGIDKKEGVKFLTEKLGIKATEVVAVGDGENDYPMFEFAGKALGVNVKEPKRVSKNYKNITDVLFYLDILSENTFEQEEDWPTQAREAMEDFIESQGIYLRQ